MQVDPVAAQHAVDVYQELKFWLPLITAGGFLWKVFQGVNWLKLLKTDIKTDIIKVETKVSEQTSAIQSQLAQQTNAIVGELKEIRQDFRMAMSPPPRLASASQKKKVDVKFENHV
jgi:hypothetical protein